jgi:hypothetical protein
MVYVFRTSVKTESDILKLEPRIDGLTTDMKWNFDLEDCENILRIDSSTISPKMIIELLHEFNYECEELE